MALTLLNVGRVSPGWVYDTISPTCRILKYRLDAVIVLTPEDCVLIVNEDPISEIKIVFESTVSDVNVPIETTPSFAII